MQNCYQIYPVILVILSLSLPVSAEEIKSDYVKLSLDKCLELADKTSYEAEIAKIDIDNLNLETARDFFVYLPTIGFRSDAQYITTSGDYSDSSDGRESNLTVTNSITFRQRLFDTNLFRLLKSKEDRKIRQEIILNTFKVKIRYLIRNVYYNILVLKEKQTFLTTILNDIVMHPNQANNLQQINLLDDQYTRLAFQEELVSIDRSMQNYLSLLLNTIRYPLDIEIKLTTKLDNIKQLDKKEALRLALENDVYLKDLYTDLLFSKNALSLSTLDYFPRFNIRLSHLIDNKFEVDLLLDLHGSQFSGDIIGSHKLYAKDFFLTDEELISEKDLRELDQGDRLSINVVGYLDLDQILSNKLRRDGIKNTIKKIQIQLTQNKGLVNYLLKTRTTNISEYEREIQLSENKIDYLFEEKKALNALTEEGMVRELDFDLIKYYKDVNNLLKTEIQLLFNKYFAIYEQYASYFSIIDGGAKINLIYTKPS